MKLDQNLTDACHRMRWAGEIESSLDCLMVEYRNIELSTKLPLEGKRQLLKCLDVTIEVMKRALARYAKQAMDAWKLYEETNGIQPNTEVNSTSQVTA